MKKSNENREQLLAKKVANLESVLAHMPGHVYWIDRDGVYLGCNNNQAKFAQLPSREAIVGKSLHEMIPYDIAERVNALNLRVMEHDEPYIGEEICDVPHYEGIYLSQKVPIKNDQNEVIGMLGVSLDITENKRIERELKEAKEKAELANQAKTEFIRNMEHDIRTPLCGIMSVASYLHSIEQDPQKKELLSDLEVTTNELLSYLDNIVEFSQINTSSVPLIPKEFDLESLLQGILRLEFAAAKHKELELILDYPETLPKMVIIDRFRLHRIILNLVNNAIKFTHKGYIKICVSKVEHEQANDITLEISIEDTGIGISKKQHEIIYDKFIRGEPANKGLYKGTGLGLWIVKNFINDLGGEITLQSEIEKGSKFICRLPFKIPEKKHFIENELCY